MRSILILSLLLAPSLFAQETRSDRYERRDAGRQATVMEGTVIDIRSVTMRKNANEAYTGMTIGAATGAAVGAVATKGKDNSAQNIAAIAGGALGGLAGANIERAATKVVADEFIIKLSNGQLVSISQAMDPSLRIGSPVYVVYSDRIRVIPADQPGR